MDEITAAPDLGHGAHGSIIATDDRRDFDNGAVSSQFSNRDDPTLTFRDETAVPDNSFAFSPTQLHKLLTARSLPALRAFGGLQGLAAGLRTDTSAGLSVDETHLDGAVFFEEAVAAGRARRPAIIIGRQHQPQVAPRSHGLHLGDPPDDHFVDRKRVFGENSLPRRKQKSFFRLMWIAFNDKLIILLTISATVSLAIGIYQSVDASVDASSIQWVDGVTIVAAILIIILASAAMDWQKNQKFKKLNERKEQRDVTVVRSGRIQRISVYDVLVGDVMHIEAGDVVPVDGVLIHASSVQIDESSISGESDLVHKSVPTEQDPFLTLHSDPFILSGTTVSRGVGRYLVTSVGVNSTYGRVLISLRNTVEETPLQAKLGRLGKHLIIIGAVAGSIFFFILFVRFLVSLRNMATGPSQKAETFLHVLIISVAVVVITVPEGLALNVTIALAFATKRMLRDNNLVRLLRSCEIMGNATSVCSDKTGTLTQNKMTVVAGRIGLESCFDDVELIYAEPDVSMSRAPTIRCDTSAQLATALSPEAKKMIKDSIALNSTAFESDHSDLSKFVGSSTETALLDFSRDHLGLGILNEERANSPVVAMLPFDSTRKWMAVLIKLQNGNYRLLVKGAAELVFEYCAFTVSDPTYKLPTARISEENRSSFQNTIRDYASKMLRPVAITYRDFDESDVFESLNDDPDYVNLEWLASGMVLVGVFGIRDPLRPEVVESVRQCQSAGVFVRMVTGDNFLTAKAVAAECGIYTAGGVAMDGPTFRALKPEQLDAVIPRLQVLARSSPEDKLLLVSHLKGMNETVAVTGDGTNDALALKAADVGFAMGIQGTEVAKEAASIILLDDNFASIVKSLSWGRTVNDAVKKFCQFQFTINITAGIITVVSEFVGDAIFTVVQLLWINLIMDIFASLAFATDSPSPDFLKRKPEPRNAPIVSITMWKMILGQAMYQLTVVFVVHYGGLDLFNPDTEFEIEKLQTLVFNIYVWMQFFNQHNCRRVDNKLDIWYQGVFKNPWFIGVQLLTIVGQVVIIVKGGEAFDTRSLTGAQWGWSMLFGVLAIPLGALIRQFPDRLVLEFFLAIERGYVAVTASFWVCLISLIPGRRNEREEQREMGPVEEMPPQAPTTPEQNGQNEELSAEQRGELSSSAARRSRGRDRIPQDIDLQALVDAARLGREFSGATLELHPRTLKDDPILVPRSNLHVPPSQDPKIMKLVAKSNDRRVRWHEPQVLGRPGQAIIQPQSQHRKKWFSAEALLRSKRR
ncbi:Fc.00g054030.m01.CDS01 [Cosmosporella sp. VM-42]